MALGPNKTKKEELLKEVERIIDHHIERSQSECLTLAVSLLPSGFTVDDWDILEKKYWKAGWKVAKWQSDQRDGDYLEFRS